MKTKFFSFVWLLAALTFALSLSIPDGYNIGALFIFLASLCLFFLRSEWCSIDKEDLFLLVSFVCYSLSMFFAIYFDNWNVRDLDRPSRFLFVIPVIALLLIGLNHKKWLWYGSIFGAISAFFLAYYQREYLGLSRAYGGENPIMFGNIGMMLGLINFVSATYFLNLQKYKLTCLAIFAGLLGLGVSILSGTRGGWVALPIIGFFLLWQSRNLLGYRSTVATLFASIMLILIVCITPQTGIKDRLSGAIDSFTNYEKGVKKESSVGHRFDMWKAAIVMFKESPIFGVGGQGSVKIKQELVQKKIISSNTLRYSHAHNEYLEALSKRGLIGLFFLFLVYLVPLKLFLLKMKRYSNNWKIKSYAMAGALVPMSYMDFSLTQVMFGHNIGVMMYVFPIAFFWAATRWAEREERELGNIA